MQQNLNYVIRKFSLSLEDVHLKEIDDEINRLLRVEVLEKKQLEQRNKFIESIQRLRQRIAFNIIEELKKECKIDDLRPYDFKSIDVPDTLKENIQKNSQVHAAVSLASTLKNLKYTPESKKDDYETMIAFGQKHYLECRKNPYIRNFFKGVASVALSGIGFLLGLPTGAVIGFIKGLKYCVVGSLFTTPYYALAGAMAGAEIGNKMAKEKLGLAPYSSTGRHLLFLPPAVDCAAIKVYREGSKFFKTETKPATVPHKDKLEKAEVTSSMKCGFGFP